MPVFIAITGKSGSGKTSVTKAIFNILNKRASGKSILLIDNDLTLELSDTFGINTVYSVSDIKTGKYKYQSKLPHHLSKQEYLEWALQDILLNVSENIDLISSGYVSAKECLCYISAQTKDALVKLVNSYDIVIADCEYDLEYLLHFMNYQPDITLIIADAGVSSVYSAVKIKQSSEHLALPGQIGIVLNKVKNRTIPEHTANILKEHELDILGILPYDENIKFSGLEKKSDLIENSIKEILFRLNLPLSQYF